jgi:hypothetical protein
MQALLPLLIFIPCLLMVVMMMRGHGHKQKPPAAASVADLHKRRKEFDRLIDDRERSGDGTR